METATIEREKLVLTQEEALDIISDDNKDFDVVFDIVTGKSRWSVNHSVIIKRISDGKFFKDYYSEGATEYQDESPWQNIEPNFIQVFEKEKVIKVYE